MEVLAWQQSKDATEKPPKNVPVYVPLPGSEPEKPKKEEESMDIDDLKAFLSKPRV